MRFDTFNSQSVLILDEDPNWSRPFVAELNFVAQATESLSMRESRRAFGGALRWVIKFSATLSGASSLALAGGLRDYLSQPVLLPFWPALVEWQDRASSPWSAGLKIVFKADWSQWEIYTSTEPTWPDASDNWAPLLWGRLEQRDVTHIDVELTEFLVHFVETGDPSHALQPASQTWTAGPSITGYGTAPKRFPFAPDFVSPVDSHAVSIQRDTVGFRRDQIESSYASTPARSFGVGVMLASVSAIAQAARWFLDYAPGGSFWTPSTAPCARLSANITTSATTFAVEEDAVIKVGDYLALCSAGSIVQTCKVTGVSSNTITVSAGLSAADSGNITVHQLILGRLEKAKLTIPFEDVAVASIEFDVVEVVPEVSIPADETLGSTLGALATRCYLYELSQTVGGATYYERWTSYESDITYGGNTFTSGHFSHGDIRRGVAIDKDEVEIRTKFDSTKMIGKVVTLKSELPVMLSILVGSVSSGAAVDVVTVYFGEVVRASLRGKLATARVVSGGSLFDRKLPHFFLQPTCNHSLFSTGCGLAESAWKFSAVVAATISADYPFKVELSTLARVTGTAPTFSDQWFAGGWIEYGSGASTQRRAIMQSDQLTSTTLDLYLRRPFDSAPSSGATVYLWPGCDGTMETCLAKFANFDNFGGHPFIPSTNPSLLKVSKNAAGGKK